MSRSRSTSRVGACAMTHARSAGRDLVTREQAYEKERIEPGMTNSAEIVERYLGALYGGDPQTARQHLADNLSFRGPAASFSSADEYLRATEHAVRIVSGLEKRKVFVDGPDVCMFYDLLIDHPVASIAI